MSKSIDASAIDTVLEEAVAAGAVPHVAAIAADRDGIFYEGGAGVRAVGEADDRVTTRRGSCTGTSRARSTPRSDHPLGSTVGW